MERLTGYIDGGIVLARRLIGDTDWLHAVLDRLASYEDSGLSPERVQELAAAEREGRLIIPPCGCHDTVWIIDNGAIRDFEVVGVHFRNGLILTYAECKEQSEGCVCVDRKCCGVRFTPENMRKQFVFLTRPDAEAALAKMKEE